MHYKEDTGISEDYARLETLDFETVIPQGARFLTQFGYLDVTFYAPGIIRLHLQTKQQPDYNLLAASPEPVEVKYSSDNDVFRLSTREVALELMSGPVRIRLKQEERTVLESPDDRSIRGDLHIEGDQDIAAGIQGAEVVDEFAHAVRCRRRVG